jgi:hypothetical protein
MTCATTSEQFEGRERERERELVCGGSGLVSPGGCRGETPRTPRESSAAREREHYCDGSGQNLELSGGDPPNPPPRPARWSSAAALPSFLLSLAPGGARSSGGWRGPPRRSALFRRASLGCTAPRSGCRRVLSSLREKEPPRSPAQNELLESFVGRDLGTPTNPSPPPQVSPPRRRCCSLAALLHTAAPSRPAPSGAKRTASLLRFQRYPARLHQTRSRRSVAFRAAVLRARP